MGRAYYGIFIFAPAALISFNAGFWQIWRRRQKTKLMQDFDNIRLPARDTLPTVEDPAGEYTPVKLDGTLDNEGSVLVGPRVLPSRNNRPGSDGARGGFFVLTPFEVAATRQFIMVNRGWVPIDACKSRLHLAQYIGEGFQKLSLRGLIRKEETVTDWRGNLKPQCNGPIQGAMSWQLIRPYEAVMQYFRRRFGIEQVTHREEVHGARHYLVEMIEDMSGEDQTLVDGVAIPYRRDIDEITYTALLPIHHTIYSCFWFLVCASSCFVLRKSFRAHKLEISRSMLQDKQRKEFEEKTLKSAQDYQREVEKVLAAQKGLPTNAPNYAGRAVGAKDSAAAAEAPKK